MNFIESQRQLNELDSITFVVDKNGEAYSIEKILAYNKDADAAIFKITPSKKHLIIIPVGVDLRVGETVHTITNPEN